MGFQRINENERRASEFEKAAIATATLVFEGSKKSKDHE